MHVGLRWGRAHIALPGTSFAHSASFTPRGAALGNLPRAMTTSSLQPPPPPPPRQPQAPPPTACKAAPAAPAAAAGPAEASPPCPPKLTVAAECRVPPLPQPTRLDAALVQLLPAQFPSVSRSKRSIRRGELLVEGQRAATTTELRGGELVQWLQRAGAQVLRPEGRHPAAQPHPAAATLGVLWEDEHMACMVKPQGMAAGGIGSCGRAGVTLQQCLPHVLEPSGVVGALRQPHHAHRLDDATGGLLLVGKTQEALRTLCACFAGRGVAKRYRALAWGRLEGRGLVRHALDGKPSETEYLAVAHSMVLGRCGCASGSGSGSSGSSSASSSASGDEGVSSSTSEDSSGSSSGSDRGDSIRTAGSSGTGGTESTEGPSSGGISTARAARAVGGPNGSSGGGCGCPPQWATTLDLWPHTGRMHQLRRHLALIGHPLVGDAKYTHGYRAQREAAGLHLREEDHVRLGVEGAGGESGGQERQQQRRQQQRWQQQRQQQEEEEEEEEGWSAPLSQAGAVQGSAAAVEAGGEGVHGAQHSEQQQRKQQQQQEREQRSSGGAAGSTSGVAAALASGHPGELCLWALELQLPHPITGAPMQFQLEEPPLFEATRALLAAGEQLPPGR